MDKLKNKNVASSAKLHEVKETKEFQTYLKSTNN